VNQPSLFMPSAPACVLSPDGRYRYSLTIPLESAGGTCLFVLANPSTAVVVNGVFQSDPTVTKCIKYARRWGYGRAVVANARAWRETNPKLVPADPLAIGPDNDGWIESLARQANLVICGYGRLGGVRGPVVLELVRSADKTPHALKLTPDGVPYHPLYLRDDAKPFPMVAA
jgi:hypothetical protein